MLLIVVAVLVGVSLFGIVGFKYYLLKRDYNRLTRIETIGSKLRKDIEIKELIRNIIVSAKDMLEAEACSLYLVDESKENLYFEVALGEKEHLLKKIKVKIGEGVSGLVAQTGEILNIPDISKDERFNKNRKVANAIGFKEKAMLTVPILLHNEILGVIQFINKKNGSVFTKRDEETVMLFIQIQIVNNLEKAILYDRLRETFVDTIETLVSTIEARDENTQGHSKRVSEMATLLGMYLQLSAKEVEDLRYAGILHDVGKIGIRDAVLNKKGQLSDDEYDIMKTHPMVGKNILTNVSSLAPCVVEATKYHHERYDGKGYPDGLVGEAIPIFARILAVVDTFDAMTCDRVYRKGLPKEVALAEIEKGKGTQFDPYIAEQFIKMLTEESNETSKAKEVD